MSEIPGEGPGADDECSGNEGAGVVLFVLPIPGTFVTGALVVGAGALARYLGH